MGQLKRSLVMSIQLLSKPQKEIEREVNISDKDASKPLLLRLVEQVKFGAPPISNQSVST